MAKSPRATTPRFHEQARVVLQGSEKAAAENAVHVKATPARTKVTVSVIVKRKEPLRYNRRPGRSFGPVRVSRAEYKRHHAADPNALARAATLSMPPLPPTRRRLETEGVTTAEKSAAAPTPTPRPGKTTRPSAANPYGSLIVDAFSAPAPSASATPVELRGVSP